jgi:hypothetical protein
MEPRTLVGPSRGATVISWERRPFARYLLAAKDGSIPPFRRTSGCRRNAPVKVHQGGEGSGQEGPRGTAGPTISGADSATRRGGRGRVMSGPKAEDRTAAGRDRAEARREGRVRCAMGSRTAGKGGDRTGQMIQGLLEECLNGGEGIHRAAGRENAADRPADNRRAVLPRLTG